jgi:hypothetical protein
VSGKEEHEVFKSLNPNCQFKNTKLTAAFVLWLVGRCNPRGLYVQMFMASLCLLVVRTHMKKRCEPGSKAFGYVEKGFKPAFDYNIKLELIAKGEWPPPKEPPKVDADGVPIAKVERIKYKAKQKMDDTKAAAQKKVKEVTAKAKAKAKAGAAAAKAKLKAGAAAAKEKFKEMRSQSSSAGDGDGDGGDVEKGGEESGGGDSDDAAKKEGGSGDGDVEMGKAGAEEEKKADDGGEGGGGGTTAAAAAVAGGGAAAAATGGAAAASSAKGGNGSGEGEEKGEGEEEAAAGGGNNKGGGQEDMLGDTQTEGAAAEAGMLPPDHPDYKPQAGWQVMILPAACKEMFSKKKGVEDEDLFQKYPVPEEMSSLAPAALATLLPPDKAPELRKLLTERGVSS